MWGTGLERGGRIQFGVHVTLVLGKMILKTESIRLNQLFKSRSRGHSQMIRLIQPIHSEAWIDS